MLMIFFRHGNTFAEGDDVVCAGRQPGLPLVAAGVLQAERAGRALAAAGCVPREVCASPRLRTQQFAAALLRAAGGDAGAVREDARLDELDYGPWTGRTREAIVAAGGAAAVHAWDELGRWPSDASFGGEEAGVQRELEELLAEVEASSSGVFVAVSHAGRMRYLPTCTTRKLPADNWPGPHRVRCGHATVLRRTSTGLQLLGANLAPEALRACVGAHWAPSPSSSGSDAPGLCGVRRP